MPLLNVFWSIFLIFLLVAWIWVLISVISDVFRSKDLNGFSKGLWIIFIIVIPWLGVLVYLIARGDGMHERNEEAFKAAEDAQRKYIRSVAHVSTADELSKLAELKEKGVISDSEFEEQKSKLLS